MQRQRLLQINDSETLTVGQMGILRVGGGVCIHVLHVHVYELLMNVSIFLQELKLANDNLRWRLRQREVVISSHGATIANLQKRLREAQLREEAAVEQARRCCCCCCSSSGSRSGGSGSSCSSRVGVVVIVVVAVA